MTAEQFTYWLQGFFELSGATTLNEQQVKIVKDHIALVMTKVTPNVLTIRAGGGILDSLKNDKICTKTTDTVLNLPTVVTC